MAPWLLRRDEGDRTEFITYSTVGLLDSVRAFAGDDFERAVYYPDDERYLVERDDRVPHYSVEDYVAP